MMVISFIIILLSFFYFDYKVLISNFGYYIIIFHNRNRIRILCGRTHGVLYPGQRGDFSLRFLRFSSLAFYFSLLPPRSNPRNSTPTTTITHPLLLLSQILGILQSSQQALDSHARTPPPHRSRALIVPVPGRAAAHKRSSNCHRVVYCLPPARLPCTRGAKFR